MYIMYKYIEYMNFFYYFQIQLNSFKCKLCLTRCSSKLLFLHHMSQCRRSLFKRTHAVYKQKSKSNICKICKKLFKSRVQLEYHIGSFHQCKYCNFEGSFSLIKKHLKLLQNQIGGNRLVPKDCTNLNLDNIKPFKLITAFKGFVRTFRHKCKSGYPTLLSYLNAIKSHVFKLILKSNMELKSIKVQLSVYVTFKRYLCESDLGNAVYEYQYKIINSNMIVVNNSHYFENFFSKCVAKLDSSVEIFEQYGSGWIVHEITGCDVRIGMYRPFKGACWIQIPKKVSNKKCVINVRNKDNFCFKWGVLAALHSKSVSSGVCRVKSYVEFEKLYDFSDLEFPVELKFIPKFESKNSLAVNVFSWDFKEGLIPAHISKLNYKTSQTVNLLIISHPSAEHYHYAAIIDINKLLGKDNSHRKFLCFNCLQRIASCKKNCLNQSCDRECKLKDHLFYCERFMFQKVKCPIEKNEIPSIRFRHFENQLKAGYVIYADFEALLKPLNNKKAEANIIKEKKHQTTGFAYAVVKFDGSVLTHRVYRGEDCIEVFLSDVAKIAKLIIQIYKTPVPIEMSEIDLLNFENATHCHICSGIFQSYETKFRDHCHISGKYRGAAHCLCNFLFQQKLQVPVITHNFRGYDSHFIIKGFDKFGTEFNVIPTNSEKYLSVKVV